MCLWRTRENPTASFSQDSRRPGDYRDPLSDKAASVIVDWKFLVGLSRVTAGMAEAPRCLGI